MRLLEHTRGRSSEGWQEQGDGDEGKLTIKYAPMEQHTTNQWWGSESTRWFSHLPHVGVLLPPCALIIRLSTSTLDGHAACWTRREPKGSETLQMTQPTCACFDPLHCSAVVCSCSAGRMALSGWLLKLTLMGCTDRCFCTRYKTVKPAPFNGENKSPEHKSTLVFVTIYRYRGALTNSRCRCRVL